MEMLSFSKARENLATTFDSVTQNSTPIIITRQNKEPVVIMSMEDFKSYTRDCIFIKREDS